MSLDKKPGLFKNAIQGVKDAYNGKSNTQKRTEVYADKKSSIFSRIKRIGNTSKLPDSIAITKSRSKPDTEAGSWKRK